MPPTFRLYGGGRNKDVTDLVNVQHFSVFYRCATEKMARGEVERVTLCRVVVQVEKSIVVHIYVFPTKAR